MPTASTSKDPAEGRQIRLAIGGPCGSGKSSLASFLAAEDPQFLIVREPSAPRDIRVAGVPQSDAIEGFQRQFATFRKSQATAGAGRKLLFDRTFEEDREVFLPLHYQLGFISTRQLEELTRLSIECENSIGPPDATLVLTAPPDILRRRLQAATEQRPQWLVDHISLQCELYADWIAKKADGALILDTSEIDKVSLADMAKRYFDGLA